MSKQVTLRSTALGRPKSAQDLARKSRRSRMLGHSSQALMHAADEATLRQDLCEIIVDTGGYLMALVALAEHGDEMTWRPVAHTGFAAACADPAMVIAGGMVLHAEEPSIACDIPDAARRGYRSVIALPLTDEGRVFGTLAIFSGETQVFEAEEVADLSKLASDLAFRIAGLRACVESKLARRELHETEARYQSLIAARQATLHFFASMDRVNHAIQETNNLEQMMGDVLEVVLSIFECDRAWLVYPCDLESTTWRASMERTRPEYPGVSSLGLELPIDPEVLGAFRTVLTSDGPVRFGPGSPHPLATVAEQFGVQSMLAMATYPKGDKPYMFGLHQCSHARAWTAEDTTLFQEIGRRLADGLSSMLAYRNLRGNEARLRALLQTIPDPVWLKDPEGVFLWCNPQFERLFGAAEAQIVGKTDYDFADKEQADGFRENDRKAMAARKPRTNEEWLTFADNGYRGLFETVKTPMWDDDGKAIGVVGVARDITARKAAEKEIENLAYYDSLTQLPNRRLLLDRLQQALAQSARSRLKGALLIIDLDNFKILNDTVGHEVGDQLLCEVAQRLAGSVCRGDTIARLGGDEFVIMLEDLSECPLEAAAQAKSKGEQILSALNLPYTIAGRVHHSTPSIGVALFTDTGNSVDELLKQADIAMYQAKSAGRNALRFFDPDTQAALTDRANLESALRLGIRDHQFVLHYQPQVDSVHGITGAEALLRWEHPGRGTVMPAEFVPLAEETALILPIGQWVLDTACAQLEAWSGNPRTRHLFLAINVSARQFKQADFVDCVRMALNEAGAPAERLKLELTESLVLDDVEGTINKMQALRQLGVGFSMDDFGTGYSSLSYLTRLPLDQLKIDQSFVRNLPDSPTDAVVTQTIITLARSLGLTVIAEGVETEAQRQFLERHGCPAYQGYLFSKAVAPAEFEQLLTGA
jgi:diguanylate cyclase (GGDEF)-like protein/PAS domain S-box-containing protein